MTDEDWQSRFYEIVSEVAPEFMPNISEISVYHFAVTLQINDPERSNITCSVYRKKNGIFSLKDWAPVSEATDLKERIVDYFLSFHPQKTFDGIPQSALRDFERLAEELAGVGTTITWKQVEDFRARLSAKGLSGQRCDLLVYYKNSGISAKRTSVNFLNGDEQLGDQIKETLSRLFPNQESDR
jgi:hypothetical protein